MEWAYIALVIVIVAAAMFVVPVVADRLARKSIAEEERWRDRWIHEHEDRERKDPPPRRGGGGREGDG
jgi:Ni/Co efflux regulator RcnB